MKIIILDMGSGNTCKNDIKIVKRMYDELHAIDNKKFYIITKWQLFKEAGDNIPLKGEVFQFAYNYGRKLGYEVFASVFDIESLAFYSNFDITSIKIANNDKSYELLQYIPCNKHLFISFDNKRLDHMKVLRNSCDYLCCISEYPAKINDYLQKFSKEDLKDGISDHTENFDLYKAIDPHIIEWHYKLEDSTGLDAGVFARTPQMLKNIL